MTQWLTDGSLRALADELPSLVFIADADGEAVYFNRTFRDFTGWGWAELLGRAWLLTVHEEDRAPVRVAWKQAIAAEEPYEVEYRLRAADGHYHWFLIRCVPVATDGRVDHWVGVGIDIHDRKLSAVNASAEFERTQDALARSESRVQRIVDSGVIGVVYGNVDGVIGEVNDAFLAMIGQTREAFSAGRIRWRDLAAPEYADLEQRAITQLQREGACEPYEIEYRLPGRRLPVQITMARVESKTADIDHVALIVDLSVQKAAQAALAAGHAELEQRVADRTAELKKTHERLLHETRHREALQGALLQSQKLDALGRLTSRVAYDFNTTFAAISGGFDLILSTTEDPELRKLATEGRRAAHRGTNLIQNLAQFARRQNNEPRRVVLKTAFDAWAPELRLIAGSRVEVVIGDSRALPAVQIDPSHLRIAITNLVVNARDAMPDGGRVNIDFQHVPHDHPDRPRELDGACAVAIHVSDNGVGMPPAVLQRAVEPFHTTKIPEEGAGLGLAMAHSLMIQSDGALRLRSVVGSGATVSLFIPIALASATIEDGPRGRADGEGSPAEEQGLVQARVEAYLDRLAVRVNSPIMYRMLKSWRRARQGDALPALKHVRVGSAELDFVAHVAVDQTRVPMTFELTNVGAELVRRAETDFTWWRLDVSGDNAETSREGVYGRCVRSRKPTYDFARFDLGQEGGSFFKRLLLPCSEDGLNVTSLIVIVNFDETTPANEA